MLFSFFIEAKRSLPVVDIQCITNPQQKRRILELAAVYDLVHGAIKLRVQSENSIGNRNTTGRKHKPAAERNAEFHL